VVAEERLCIRVAFPQGAYSGSDIGAAEELPSPSRLHEALVAAAAGGIWAKVDDRVLVARDDHRAALEWLERHEPIGVIAPQREVSVARARRYRWRASPEVLFDTDFEPRSALDGPVVYVWPAAPDDVVSALKTIAREVTHVGRADSVAIVSVDQGPPDRHRGTPYENVPGRGPGHVMRVPVAGRTDALVRAHRHNSTGGEHRVGSLGRQATDQRSDVNDVATQLRRFAPPAQGDWPYEEVWVAPISTEDDAPRRLLAPALRVAAAVAIHRRIVRIIGQDVPPFVTGRDGDGPLRGAGHLAIHLAQDDRSSDVVALLALPPGVPEADRDMLLGALQRPLRVGLRRGGELLRLTIAPPRVRPALPFWAQRDATPHTAVPLVLDVPGRPRQAPWSIADAVVCSIGYAMRGVLERAGHEWGTGWGFRRELVALLREHYGVEAAARRVPVNASRYVHRAPSGDLLVAVHAVVDLGRLAPEPGGFLALGRSRHLGGGLLVETRP
jgi:CRISPR-associated protein Csb2